MLGRRGQTHHRVVRTHSIFATLPAALLALAGAPRLEAQLPGSTGACETRADRGTAGLPGEGPGGRPATDLHCISLFSTATGGDAFGFVELDRVSSPFGVAVTPAGHHIRDLTAHIEGLPPPSSLGPYTVYMAWATPLELDPVVPLGPVDNGEHSLGPVAFNKYLVMVTAEASIDVASRQGPLVLRGRSRLRCVLASPEASVCLTYAPCTTS